VAGRMLSSHTKRASRQAQASAGRPGSHRASKHACGPAYSTAGRALLRQPTYTEWDRLCACLRSARKCTNVLAVGIGAPRCRGQVIVLATLIFSVPSSVTQLLGVPRPLLASS